MCYKCGDNDLSLCMYHADMESYANAERIARLFGGTVNYGAYGQQALAQIEAEYAEYLKEQERISYEKYQIEEEEKEANRKKLELESIEESTEDLYVRLEREKLEKERKEEETEKARVKENERFKRVSNVRKEMISSFIENEFYKDLIFKKGTNVEKSPTLSLSFESQNLDIESDSTLSSDEKLKRKQVLSDLFDFENRVKNDYSESDIFFNAEYYCKVKNRLPESKRHDKGLRFDIKLDKMFTDNIKDKSTLCCEDFDAAEEILPIKEVELKKSSEIVTPVISIENNIQEVKSESNVEQKSLLRGLFNKLFK